MMELIDSEQDPTPMTRAGAQAMVSRFMVLKSQLGSLGPQVGDVFECYLRLTHYTV